MEQRVSRTTAHVLRYPLMAITDMRSVVSETSRHEYDSTVRVVEKPARRVARASSSVVNRCSTNRTDGPPSIDISTVHSLRSLV